MRRPDQRGALARIAAYTALPATAMAIAAMAGCTSAQVQTAANDGRLFCATATNTGPLVVSLANSLGAPVLVTNQAAADVAKACALIDAIPVMPPANPAAAPVVAVTTSLPAVGILPMAVDGVKQ